MSRGRRRQKDSCRARCAVFDRWRWSRSYRAERRGCVARSLPLRGAEGVVVPSCPVAWFEILKARDPRGWQIVGIGVMPMGPRRTVHVRGRIGCLKGFWVEVG